MSTGITRRRSELRAALTSRAANPTTATAPALIPASSGSRNSHAVFPQEIDQHILSFILDGNKLPANFSCLQLVSRSTWLLTDDWLNSESANKLLSSLAARQSSNPSSKANETLEILHDIFFSSDPIARFLARGQTRKARKSMNNFSWPHLGSLNLKLIGEQTRAGKRRLPLSSARGANFSGIDLAEIAERGILKEMQGKPLSLSLSASGLEHMHLATLFDQCQGSRVELDLTIDEYIEPVKESAESTAILLVPLRRALDAAWKSGTMRIWCAAIDSHALMQCIEPEDWRLELRNDDLLARHKSQDKAIQVFSGAISHRESQALDILETGTGFLYQHHQLIRKGGALCMAELSGVALKRLLDQLKAHTNPRLSLLDLGSATQATDMLTADERTVLCRLPAFASKLKLTRISFSFVDFTRLSRSIRRHPLEQLALVDCGLERIDSSVLNLNLKEKPLSVPSLALGLDQASGEWLMDALPALVKDPCLKELSIRANGDIHALGLHAVVAAALDSSGSGSLLLHWTCCGRPVIVDIPRACSKKSPQRKATLAKVQEVLNRPPPQS